MEGPSIFPFTGHLEGSPWGLHPWAAVLPATPGERRWKPLAMSSALELGAGPVAPRAPLLLVSGSQRGLAYFNLDEIDLLGSFSVCVLFTLIVHLKPGVTLLCDCKPVCLKLLFRASLPSLHALLLVHLSLGPRNTFQGLSWRLQRSLSCSLGHLSKHGSDTSYFVSSVRSNLSLFLLPGTAAVTTFVLRDPHWSPGWLVVAGL